MKLMNAFFSIIIDTTQDISKTDKISLAMKFAKPVNGKKSFML